MKTVFLGLIVALLWGSADTLATFSTKKIGSAATTRIAQAVGFLLVALVALSGVTPLGLVSLSPHVLFLSILFGGVLGSIAAGAYGTLYKALSHGPLAVVSPVVSTQGGVTLLLAVLLLQERLEAFPFFFLLVTFAGVLLTSTDVRALRQPGLLKVIGPGGAYALASLACFGLLSFGLGIAARATGWLISVFWIRFFSFLFLAAFLPQTDPDQAGVASRGWGYLLAGVVGAADIAGLLLLSAAMTSGSIGIAGMLSSVYGVIPLVVGVCFLKERLTASQVLGCVLLGAGIVGEVAPGQALALPLAAFVALLAVGSILTLLTSLARRRLRAKPESLKHGEWLALGQALHANCPPSDVGRVMGLIREFAAGFGTLADLSPGVAIWGSARIQADHPTYAAAVATARLLAQAGFGVMTGGGPGIMEAANRGAQEEGGLSIGCTMTSLANELPNAFQDVSLAFHSFSVRKTMFVTYAEAMVIFPGGYGTLDELFEILVLVQMKKVRPIPIILYDSAFWGGLLDWIRCTVAASAKTIHPEELDLLLVSDDPQEIVRIVLDAHQMQTEAQVCARSR
jgi:uncharacterized protein (TIGR00730 family)